MEILLLITGLSAVLALRLLGAICFLLAALPELFAIAAPLELFAIAAPLELLHLQLHRSYCYLLVLQTSSLKRNLATPKTLSGCGVACLKGFTCVLVVSVSVLINHKHEVELFIIFIRPPLLFFYL